MGGLPQQPGSNTDVINHSEYENWLVSSKHDANIEASKVSCAVARMIGPTTQWR